MLKHILKFLDLSQISLISSIKQQLKTKIPFLAINLQQRAHIIQFLVQKKVYYKGRNKFGGKIFPNFYNEGGEEVKKQKLVK